jgi:hypothetical protein
VWRGVIKELRLYLRLRPYIEKEIQLMQMKLTSNVILQMIATAIQGLNALSDVVPPKYKFWVATGVGVLQMIGSVVAHFSPPPGATTETK